MLFFLLSNRRATFPVAPYRRGECGYSSSSFFPKYEPILRARFPTERETSHWKALPILTRPALSTFVSPFIPILFFYIFMRGLHFRFVVPYCHRVFEVRRRFFILRSDSPSVAFLHHVPTA